MKKITDLDLEKFGEIVAKNETLKEKFYDRIYDAEMNFYLEDKLRCFERGCLEYEFAPYFPSHMYVRNGHEIDALAGIEESARKFGCSPRLQKRIDQCKKLEGTNLFEWHVRNLVQQYFKEEICATLDWLENVSYKLSCKEIHPDVGGELELFQEECDGYFYNEETGDVFQWRKVS